MRFALPILNARILVALPVIVLSACSGDVNPVRDAAVAVGAGSQPRQRPDFVARSRPDQLDYVPVGAPAATRGPGKTAEEVKAAEADLERKRTANEGQAESARRLGASPAPKPASR